MFSDTIVNAYKVMKIWLIYTYFKKLLIFTWDWISASLKANHGQELGRLMTNYLHC